MVEKFCEHEKAEASRQDYSLFGPSGRERNSGYAAPFKGDNGKGKTKGKDGGKSGKKKDKRPLKDNPPEYIRGDCQKFFNSGKCPDHAANNCAWKHERTRVLCDENGKPVRPLKDNKKEGKRKDGKNGKGQGKDGKKGKGKGKDGKGRSQSGERRGKSPSGLPDRASCEWHKKGKCTKGDQCNSYHVPICWHFPRGECRNHNEGKSCPFAHQQSAGNATPAKGSASRQQSKDDKAKAAKKKEAKAKKAEKKRLKETESPLNQ